MHISPHAHMIYTHTHAPITHTHAPITHTHTHTHAHTTADVRQEHGQEAVEEACEGLVLLHEQGNRSARYWCCPTCDQKFHSGREFLAHIELAHEEVAVQVRMRS